MIIYIILGTVIWQSVCCIACTITNKDEVIIYTAIGIWSPILLIAGKLYRIIKLKLSRKYNCYQIYTISSGWVTNICMTPEVASKFRTVEEYGHDYAIKLLREGKDFKSCPMKQEIVREGQIFPGMSRDTFRKFLKVS